MSQDAGFKPTRYRERTTMSDSGDEHVYFVSPEQKDKENAKPPKNVVVVNERDITSIA